MANPYQTPIYTEQSTTKPGSLHRGRVVLCLLPLISYAYVWLFALVASMNHGHWVQPGVDDPRDVLWGIPLAIHFILQTFAFALVPGALLLSPKDSTSRVYVYGMIYVVNLILSIALYRLDLWQLTIWIAD